MVAVPLSWKEVQLSGNAWTVIVVLIGLAGLLVLFNPVGLVDMAEWVCLVCCDEEQRRSVDVAVREGTRWLGSVGIELRGLLLLAAACCCSALC